MEFKNLIQRLNYTLILPRTGIKPLDLILRKEGNLFSFFKPAEGVLANSPLKNLFDSTDYPEIKKADLPTELLGKDILDTQSKFVASLLEDNSASAHFQNKKQVLFSFENTVSTAVDWFDLNEYLWRAVPKKAHEEILRSGKVYVILSVLASKKFSIQTIKDLDLGADVSTNQLVEELGKLEVGASHSVTQDYVIRQEGEKPLTFAIKTARIIFKNKQYCITDQNIMVRNGSAKIPDDIEFYQETSEIEFV